MISHADRFMAAPHLRVGRTGVKILRVLQALIVPVAILVLASACAPAMKSTADKPLTSDQLAELWVEPSAPRDLYYGPGGRDNAPNPGVTYKVTGRDTAGFSKGYDVEDPDGREWRIKLGPEVMPEVVASRLLWGIGYHQPALYVSGPIKLDGGSAEDEGRIGRFRLEEGYKTEGDWSWHENPYVGTRPFKGLLVANLILNNWDLKSPQNRIYLVRNAASGPGRRYVVQDLGAALGKTSWPTGSRNNIKDYESQNLIKRVNNGNVEFDYHARHKELFKDITPADVAWTAQLFARLSDQQLDDAFRAGGYHPDVRRQFIAKLKAKIQEGLALGRAETRAARRP